MPIPNFYSNRTLDGTLLDTFDLRMALLPGSRESTTASQLAAALAYWQNVAATTTDQALAFRASLAIPWLTAEQARVQNPPTNALHITYPV